MYVRQTHDDINTRSFGETETSTPFTDDTRETCFDCFDVNKKELPATYRLFSMKIVEYELFKFLRLF